jgi:hypothetical protein
MKLFKTLLLLAMITVPLIAMAQQITDSATAGKGLSPSDSLAVTTPKISGNVSSPAATAPDYDPIGNEEEMDAEDGFDYQEWLLMWPEQDEDREYDPMDPREDGQEADTRE